VKVSSILFAVAAATLTISLLCTWFYPSVQDFMASNNMWNGVRNFSSEFGAEQIEALDDLPAFSGETVLVAIPYVEYREEELAKMKQLVNDGGVLLLMDDYGYGNSVLAYLGVGVRFSNKPLLDPLFCYKNQSMPRVTDFAPGVKESGIDVIMLNHATSLTNVMEPEAIAWSSSASFLDVNENGDWDQDEPKGPFAVAAEFRLGKGRLILVSDPSIIINAVVGRANNYGLVRYLTGHQGGPEQSEPKRILLDASHLTKAPLDVSKTRLIDAREVLASPYALLGVTAVIFAVVSRYTLKKEEVIG